VKSKPDNDAKVEAMVLRGMEQDRMKLLARQPFVGAVLMHLELVPTADDILCPTAMTDGRAVYMNCRFYAGLDLEERLFVLAHETWHCVLLHFVRRQSREPHLFNIATDLEIHFILSKEKMKEPFVLPHDPAWDGLSAEEIYEKIKKGTRKRLAVSGRGSSGIPQRSDGGGFDRHVYKKDRAAAEKGEGAGESRSDDGGAAADIDEKTVEKLRRIVIQAAQIAERRQGKLPAHIAAAVEKLRKPELKWQEILKQFVTSCYGGSRQWLPPARRYVGMGLYMQSRRNERLEAVLAIDTSGSTANDRPQFFAELANLLKSFGNYELTVIQCDCAIQHVEKFSDDRPLPRDYKWTSFGNGGTSFVPPFGYVREHRLRPQVFIYLTDGCGDAPETPPQFPVLWVLTRDGEVPAQWGRCIRLKQGADAE
jgi:predicted metal-dependent peptidase